MWESSESEVTRKQREALPWALHWEHRGVLNNEGAALLCVWVLGCC